MELAGVCAEWTCFARLGSRQVVQLAVMLRFVYSSQRTRLHRWQRWQQWQADATLVQWVSGRLFGVS